MCERARAARVGAYASREKPGALALCEQVFRSARRNAELRLALEMTKIAIHARPPELTLAGQKKARGARRWRACFLMLHNPQTYTPMLAATRFAATVKSRAEYTRQKFFRD